MVFGLNLVMMTMPVVIMACYRTFQVRSWNTFLQGPISNVAIQSGRADQSFKKVLEYEYISCTVPKKVCRKKVRSGGMGRERKCQFMWWIPFFLNLDIFVSLQRTDWLSGNGAGRSSKPVCHVSFTSYGDFLMHTFIRKGFLHSNVIHCVSYGLQM